MLNFILPEWEYVAQNRINKLKQEVQKSAKKSYSMKENGLHASDKRLYSSLFNKDTTNENT